MTPRPSLRLCLLLLVAVGTLACSESPSVTAVRHDIESRIPEARFEKEFHLRLGRVALGMIKPFARIALDEGDEEMDWLHAVKRVEVGTYRVVSLPDTMTLEPPPDLRRGLEKNGWSTLVRTKEDGETTLVLIREDQEGEIRGLFVLELDDSEMIMVSLEGRLSRVMAEALADEPGDLVGMLGS